MPHVIIIAGANGAGKSTTAPAVLKGTLGVTEFVNADTIAQGLSAFNPERAALHAGRVMLERLQQLAEERKDFAFETTLASKTFAHWIQQLKAGGYQFHLFYLWIPSPDFAVARVAERVRMGGHHVPDATVHRRYHAGLRNFFHLYKPIADTWHLFDNSMATAPTLIASGNKDVGLLVKNSVLWSQLAEEHNGCSI